MSGEEDATCCERAWADGTGLSLATVLSLRAESESDGAGSVQRRTCQCGHLSEDHLTIGAPESATHPCFADSRCACRSYRSVVSR